MDYFFQKIIPTFALGTLLICIVLVMASNLAADDQSLTLPISDEINQKMDDFHDAAEKGDKVRYLNHFAKDAVFMGTDDWERWPHDEFSKYVNLWFKDGKGWSYKPVKRFINLSSEQNIVWIDEIVESAEWGRFRGTAVLAKTGQGWKIKHYSLTLLVPNESWVDVSDIAKKGFQDRTVEVGVEPSTAE